MIIEKDRGFLRDEKSRVIASENLYFDQTSEAVRTEQVPVNDYDVVNKTYLSGQTIGLSNQLIILSGNILALSGQVVGLSGNFLLENLQKVTDRGALTTNNISGAGINLSKTLSGINIYATGNNIIEGQISGNSLIIDSLMSGQNIYLTNSIKSNLLSGNFGIINNTLSGQNIKGINNISAGVILSGQFLIINKQISGSSIYLNSEINGTPIVINGTARYPTIYTRQTDSTFSGILAEMTTDTALRAPIFMGAKSRTTGALVDDDNIFSISSLSNDGTDFEPSARIDFRIDGTVSSNTVPTSLVFLTSTTNSPTERLRISPTGNIVLSGNTLMLLSGGQLYLKNLKKLDGSTAAANGDSLKINTLSGGIIYGG